MNPALIYWVTVAAIGFAAAIGSWMVGFGYYRYLAVSRPELVKAYRPEIVRDSLLVIGLGLNLLVGILAMYPNPLRAGLGLVAILGGATTISLFAIFNFWLRAKAR